MMTNLGTWKEPINKGNNLALFLSNPFQDVQKRTKGQVANLAPPKALHTLKVQGFKEQIIIAVGQFICQLKKPIQALIGYPFVSFSQHSPGFSPVVTTFNLVRQRAVGALDVIQALLKKLRRFYLVCTETIANGQECFKPEIKPRHFTGRRLGLKTLDFQRKAQIQVIQGIALDGDSLDAANQISIFAEFIDIFTDLNLAGIYQFPAGLFEREALELGYLPESWRRGPDAVFEVAKEKLVTLLDSLYHILQCLRRNQLKPGILRTLLKPGEVFHQGVLVQVLAGQLVVSLMQSYAVIKSLASKVDGPVKMLVLFVAVQLVFVGDDHHWFF